MEPVNQPPETSPETQTENTRNSLPNPTFENKPVTAVSGKRWAVLAALGLLIVMVSAAGYLGLAMKGPQKKIVSPPVSPLPTPEPTAEPVKIIEETVFPSPTGVINEISVTPPVENSSPSGNFSVKSINLTGQKGEENMFLNWQVNGNSPKGYEVIWSTNPGPTYPSREGDGFHYLSDVGARQDTISPLAKGKIYYFRVCSYEGEDCGVYSNELAIQY